jgi:hypothetical protein
VFIEEAGDAPPADPSVDLVVLDTSWTPAAGDRADLRPLRPVVERVLARENVVDDSLAALDDWAARAHLADAFVADGVTWWYRNRMLIRWDVHELILWRHVLAELERATTTRYDAIDVPPERGMLRAAAAAGRRSRARGRRRHVLGGPALRFARLAARAGRRRLGQIAPLTPTQREERRRSAALDARVDRLRGAPGGVLAIASARFFQVLELAGRRHFADPHLGLALDRLSELGVPVTTVVLSLDHATDPEWRLIEADSHLIPDSIILERWGRWGDRLHGAGDVRRRVRAAGTPVLPVAGADLGRAVRDLVLGSAGTWLAGQRRWLHMAGRLLEDLRPGVLLVDHEGVRTPWLAAARRLGIPIVAVQHGVIFDNNPEYCHAPHSADVRPDVTCVFGEFERDLLITNGGYDPRNVVVTGSSRSDPDAGPTPGSPDERGDVRRELGVAPGSRLLVVSVAHNPVLGDLHSMAMLGRILGGPLPGVHVAIKLHPQDRAETRHEALLSGLARAGGYDAPPVSIVRQADLYRLLRSADAHLGQYSTVLTDAVVAGTPNMIAVGQAYADVLGWVDAGVATPVRSPDDVRAFMAAPSPAEPDARDRFLARHFLSGDATGRIVDVIRALLPARGSRDT